MDEMCKNPDYRGGPEVYLRHLAGVMKKRAELLLSDIMTKRALRDLFFEALDGEFAENVPIFVAMFFKGHRAPMRLAKKWEREWLAEDRSWAKGSTLGMWRWM